MKIIDCDQGTPEWWQARKGIPTASEFNRILTPKKLTMAAGAESYINELIADTFRTNPPESLGTFASRAVEHGVETEAEARRYYEWRGNVDVRRVGFVTTDDGRFGCSPDSLVSEHGGLELKCPQADTHVGYLRSGKLPEAYRGQVHGSLIVTGRAWWHFMSYCPECPKLEPLLLCVTPDDYTEALRKALEVFWCRYQEALGRIREMSGR